MNGIGHRRCDGYQPDHGSLDPTDPPGGLSGAPGGGDAMNDPSRPYPDGIAWDEALRQRRRAEKAEAQLAVIEEEDTEARLECVRLREELVAARPIICDGDRRECANLLELQSLFRVRVENKKLREELDKSRLYLKGCMGHIYEETPLSTIAQDVTKEFMRGRRREQDMRNKLAAKNKRISELSEKREVAVERAERAEAQLEGAARNYAAFLGELAGALGLELWCEPTLGNDILAAIGKTITEEVALLREENETLSARLKEGTDD